MEAYLQACQAADCALGNQADGRLEFNHKSWILAGAA